VLLLFIIFDTLRACLVFIFFLNVCVQIRSFILSHIPKPTYIHSFWYVHIQNKRNRIEISKLQVSVLEQKKKKKTSTAAAAADQKEKENVVVRSESKGEVVNEDVGGGGGGGVGGVKSSGSEDAKQAERIERRRRKAKKEMQALKKAMHQVTTSLYSILYMCQPLYVC
jgi:hypothetical protein